MWPENQTNLQSPPYNLLPLGSNILPSRTTTDIINNYDVLMCSGYLFYSWFLLFKLEGDDGVNLNLKPIISLAHILQEFH